MNLENISGAFADILTHLIIMNKNNAATEIIPSIPSSSDIIENIKSVCGSGK